MDSTPHSKFMQSALHEARRAADRGEVPVGAVVVHQGRIIARAHNRREEQHDATAHAEVLAIRKAGRRLGTWRLVGCTLYVTLEPCPMCAGALVQARVDHLVYGARDPKAWADLRLAEIVQNPGLNHRLTVTGDILVAESAALLRAFFQARRGCAEPTEKV